METLELGNETIYFKGPSNLSDKCPAVIYFALTGVESLTQTPINSPVNHLSSYSHCRIFSWSLPLHLQHAHHDESIKKCFEATSCDVDLLTPFLEQSMKTIQGLIEKGWINPEALGLMGLSRGCFFASHLAAKLPHSNPLLLFAPLTQLSAFGEPSNPLAERYKLSSISPMLTNKKIHIYMGLNDARVGTHRTLDWANTLTESATAQKKPIDLTITLRPSIGYKGHGTADETFSEGADWLWKQLKPN